ncbi:radical SAM protein, partial [Candidatus Woesearchaeota archaeon]|nr:radical SAM protein [Candidatus Woesearchaeota archaeon]
GLKIQLRLHNGVRVDEVNPDLLKKMKQAGFTSLSFGIESGSEKVLKRMKKSINIEQVRKAVQCSMDAGIETTVNFIIGHPEENYEDALETIKLAETLYADKINFNSAIPYPGTELYDWIKDNATFTKDVDEYLNNLSPGKVGEPFFYTKDFTKEQREELIERGLYNFRKRLIKTRFKEPFASVLALLARSDKMFTYMEVMKTKPAIINFVKPIITRRKGVNSALV